MAPSRSGSRAESDYCDVSIRTIQRSQYRGNAAMRAIVSCGPGMLWAVQILKSVPDGPVPQLAQRTIAVGLVTNAQDAVEIARTRHRRQFTHCQSSHGGRDPSQ